MTFDDGLGYGVKFKSPEINNALLEFKVMSDFTLKKDKSLENEVKIIIKYGGGALRFYLNYLNNVEHLDLDKLPSETEIKKEYGEEALKLYKDFSKIYTNKKTC